MSTPAENLGTPAADVGAQGFGALPGEDLSWITETIDVPVEGEPAPLPTDTAVGAEQGAAGADKTLAPETVEAAAKPGEVVEEVKTDAVIPAEVKPPVEPAKVEAEAETDPELTEEDSKLVQSLPAEQQPEGTLRMKRAFFMNHFLNPDKPMPGIVDHLFNKSPSRAGEMESVILERNLAKPEELAAKVYKSSPETYSKLASAVYNGDPRHFAQQVSGREDYVDPKQVQTAVEFYEAHKDQKFEDSSPLSELNEESIAEIEEYFGKEKADAVREAMQLAQKATAAEAKVEAKPDTVEDPAKATQAAEQQAAIQKEIVDIWDAGRDVIDGYAVEMAYNPQTGIGIHVTPEERAAAPLVARLKDIKAGLFFNGIEIEGKQLLPSFEQGINEWGKGRPEFMEKILHMDTFSKARERQNVLEVANGAKPLTKTYYDDRSKHPLFKEIDDIIAIVAAQSKTAPKLDTIIPGALPGTKGAATGAGGDDWLVSDAVSRVAQR